METLSENAGGGGWGRKNLAAVSALLFVLARHTPRRAAGRCVHCAVPAVVFTNSPQQNLPMGCPGLAKLPNSISFLWESDGLASWYSEGRQKEEAAEEEETKTRTR